MGTTSVLVVEHDPMQRQLFDLLFAVDGFDLTVVSSGAEALAHLREHTPSAVIAATDLPDVPGTTICQKLKSVTRLSRIPVVLVAPEPDPGTTLGDTLRRDARLAGADLLIQKPLGDKNLRERLQRLIGAPRDESGLTPAAAFSTAALEVDGLLGGAASPGAASAGPAPRGGGAASELGALRAEVARLRDENEALKLRIAKYKKRVEKLQESIEEERKRPRGLFGRRA